MGLSDAVQTVKSMDSLCDLIAEAMRDAPTEDAEAMVDDLFRECEKLRPKLHEMAMSVIDQEGGDKIFNEITMALDRLERLSEQKDGWLRRAPPISSGGTNGSALPAGIAGFGAFGGDVQVSAGVSSRAPSSVGDGDGIHPYNSSLDLRPSARPDKKKKDKKDKKIKGGPDEFGFAAADAASDAPLQDAAGASGFGAWPAAGEAAGASSWGGAAAADASSGAWGAAPAGDSGFGAWGKAGGAAASSSAAGGAAAGFDAFGDAAKGFGDVAKGGWGAASASVPPASTVASAPSAPAHSVPSGSTGGLGAGGRDVPPAASAPAFAVGFGPDAPDLAAGGASTTSRAAGKPVGAQQATMTIRCPFKEVEHDRQAFERLFVSQLATSLRIPAHRIRINAVRPGGGG